MAASSWQCIHSQCPEHPAVPGWEEHHCTGTTSYSPDLAPCDFFFSPISRWSSMRPIWVLRHNSAAEGHPWRILPAVHRWSTAGRILGRQGWESALDSRGIISKRKPCSLLLGIEINCLWYQPWYFLDTPRIHISLYQYK